ncbi:12723_t:CDS:2 [Dentiscutata heterogama]|uniref:12723_t:CDS:1 n=1 Tax=Dentiscutata heterogama TaxID=1316150 RepID=A0ACA9K4K2_9GLOM|nr:12723_t:CDS:2 [Dentiscutata heterogama]
MAGKEGIRPDEAKIVKMTIEQKRKLADEANRISGLNNKFSDLNSDLNKLTFGLSLLNPNSNNGTFDSAATSDNFSNLNPYLKEGKPDVIPRHSATDNVDDNFSRIKYSEPVITIGKALNEISEFISVHSTISQKPSITEYSEAGQLFSKLKERKDVIDFILYLQNVYAVGPDFQNNYSTLLDVKDSHNSYGGGLNESVNKTSNVNDTSIETVDKKSQCFNITANLWSSIKHDSKYKDMKNLEFMVYLENCSVEYLLSNQSPSLCGFIFTISIHWTLMSFRKKLHPNTMANHQSLIMNRLCQLMDHYHCESIELNYEALNINNESYESVDEFPMIMLKESHAPFNSNSFISISKVKENTDGGGNTSRFENGIWLRCER